MGREPRERSSAGPKLALTGPAGMAGVNSGTVPAIPGRLATLKLGPQLTHNHKFTG